MEAVDGQVFFQGQQECLDGGGILLFFHFTCSLGHFVAVALWLGGVKLIANDRDDLAMVLMHIDVSGEVGVQIGLEGGVEAQNKG